MQDLYEVNGNEWATINTRNLLLYTFYATVQYTHTYTSCSMHNIYYSLLPRFQAATDFTDVHSTCCKNSYVNGKNVHIGVYLHSVTILMSNYNYI